MLNRFPLREQELISATLQSESTTSFGYRTMRGRGNTEMEIRVEFGSIVGTAKRLVLYQMTT